MHALSVAGQSGPVVRPSVDALHMTMNRIDVKDRGFAGAGAAAAFDGCESAWPRCLGGTGLLRLRPSTPIQLVDGLSSCPPGRSSRDSEQPLTAIKYPLNKSPYAERHLIECCFSKLKRFRRVATRYEKTARNYFAVVTIAAALLWLR